MLPLLLLVAVLNPLLNHAGVTILVYVNDNPITLGGHPVRRGQRRDVRGGAAVVLLLQRGHDLG